MPTLRPDAAQRRVATHLARTTFRARGVRSPALLAALAVTFTAAAYLTPVLALAAFVLDLYTLLIWFAYRRIRTHLTGVAADLVAGYGPDRAVAVAAAIRAGDLATQPDPAVGVAHALRLARMRNSLLGCAGGHRHPCPHHQPTAGDGHQFGALMRGALFGSTQPAWNPPANPSSNPDRAAPSQL